MPLRLFLTALLVMGCFVAPTTNAAPLVAAAQHRSVFGKPRVTIADIAAQNRVSARYLTTIWQTLEQTKEEVGPVAKLEAMWRGLLVPKANQPELLSEGVGQMRDFVVRMRKDTSLKFASPMVKGLSVATQP